MQPLKQVLDIYQIYRTRKSQQWSRTNISDTLVDWLVPYSDIKFIPIWIKKIKSCQMSKQYISMSIIFHTLCMSKVETKWYKYLKLLYWSLDLHITDCWSQKHCYAKNLDHRHIWYLQQGEINSTIKKTPIFIFL
jgi:hypothetical protein